MVRISKLMSLAAMAVLSAQPLSAQVTIYRDKYGIPSIQSAKLADAVYGLGYVMALDNAERMALNFKQARGRMAEVEGRNALLADGFLRSLGFEEIAEAKAKSLAGDTAVRIRAFCEGANRGLVEQKGKIPTWIEPITPVDVLALTQLVNAAFPLQDIQRQLLPGTGSNQFAVSGKRSSNGHAIISMDPHLSWSGILSWYEFAIYSNEVQFHGITLPGLPFGSMGHTDRVAWCMTNNNPDLFDFYTVKTNPDNPKKYSYHGEWKDFEDATYELRYLENGKLETRKQTTRKTAWGPIVPLRSQAVRLSMLGSWDVLDETLNMARAKDARELREALRPVGLSMWNIVYGDVNGSIGYQYNARVPKRDESFDWTKPVPGDSPKTKWGAPLSIDELPHVEKPSSNLLVNANSSPWLTPQDGEIKKEWPAYVTSYPATTRYDRLAALLKTDYHVSPENAMWYATDTQVPYARAAVQALSGGRRRGAPGIDPETQRALDVLGRWPGRSDLLSRGCVLFVYWLRTDRRNADLARRAGQGQTWTAEERDSALASLKKAAAEMMKDHGRLDIPWGEFHVTQRGSKTAGVTGFGYVVPGDSSAAVAPASGAFKDGKIICSGGSSFRMVVNLDPKGVRSWSILPYGNSNDPNNPHFADQIEMFGRGEYKDTVFGLDRIRKEAVSKVTLVRSPSK